MIRVFITPDAKIRLDLYISEAANEVSGLGAISQVGNDLLISDIILLEQSCDTVQTKFDKFAYGRFLTSLVRKGKDPSLYRVWWHAHVPEIGCFWSSKDQFTINSFLGHSAWMVSIVGTKLGDYLTRLDVYKPFRMDPVDNLPLIVDLHPSDEERQLVKNEVLEKVKIILPPPPTKSRKLRRFSRVPEET